MSINILAQVGSSKRQGYLEFSVEMQTLKVAMHLPVLWSGFAFDMSLIKYVFLSHFWEKSNLPNLEGIYEQTLWNWFVTHWG